MADIAETVYLGHDNPIVLKLTTNGVAADLSDVTRMVIDCGAVEADSSLIPDVVAWAGDSVTLRLGRFSDLSTLGTRVTARLIVYRGGAPNGIVWLEKLKLTLKAPI